LFVGVVHLNHTTRHFLFIQEFGVASKFCLSSKSTGVAHLMQKITNCSQKLIAVTPSKQGRAKSHQKPFYQKGEVNYPPFASQRCALRVGFLGKKHQLQSSN
jgi:hypothetical protein